MKPKIFIGSSKEALDIANAIQENLENDAETTVWNQGVFDLTSNALIDLEKGLDEFDAGIFVFHPDDIIKMRNEEFKAVRDNVIFEMGLFIGRLSREFVYYVVPKNSKDLHLPTDLFGITPGSYDDKREDKNLKAALGPFCNKVREKLPQSKYDSLIRRKVIEDPNNQDLKIIKAYYDENSESIKIAIDRPEKWQILLLVSLLKAKRKIINKKFDDINRNLLFERSKEYNEEEFMKWFRSSLKDFLSLIKIAEVLIAEDLNEALKIKDAVEIKKAVDKIISVENSFLNWEVELRSIIPPLQLENLKTLITGWTKSTIDTINSFVEETESIFSQDLHKMENETKVYNIQVIVREPDNLKDVNAEIKRYYYSLGIDYPS